MSYLVLDSRCRLLGITVAVVSKFFRPEILDHRVPHIVHHFLPVLLVGVHAVHAEQSGVRIFQQGKKRVGKNIFHSCAPRVFPNLLEGRHQTTDHEVAFVIADILHHIKGNGVLHIKRSEVHHIFDPLFGDVVQEPLNRAAVRVDEYEPLAVSDVLNRHILEQG